MKKFKLFIALPILFFSFSISIVSCKKDGDNIQSSPAIIPTTITTIGGRVINETGNGVQNAHVSCMGITTNTDSHGFYMFKNIVVPEKRCVVSLSNGFDRTAKPVSGGITYCDITTNTSQNTYQLNATSGGTISDISGTSIIFQPASLLSASGNIYNGICKVEIIYLANGTDKFYRMVPAHDNLLIDANGKRKFAYSFGTIKVEIRGGNNQVLQLDPSKPATLSIPSSNTGSVIAPSSLKFASFNVNEGVWREENIALKSGGNYIGTVNHFSWWGAIIPLGVATINGQLKDVNGNPIPNATVTTTFGIESRTNQNGFYSMDVFDGTSWDVDTYVNFNMGNITPILSSPVLNPSQTYTFPDLIFTDASLISGTVVDCNSNGITGFVTIIDSLNYTNYVLATNNFTLFTGLTKTVQFNSVQGSLFNQTNFIAGASGTTTSNCNLQLCTFTPTTGNVSVTFSSPITGTSTSTLNLAYADVYFYPNQPWAYIQISSLDSLYFLGLNYYYVNFNIPMHLNYIPGTMPWSVPDTAFGGNVIFPVDLYGEANSANTLNSFEGDGYYNISNPGSSTITQFGPIGSQVTGSFNGHVIFYDGSSFQKLVEGELSVTFDITRRS